MPPNFLDHATFFCRTSRGTNVLRRFWIMLSRQLNTVKALSFMTVLHRKIHFPFQVQFRRNVFHEQRILQSFFCEVWLEETGYSQRREDGMSWVDGGHGNSCQLSWGLSCRTGKQLGFVDTQMHTSATEQNSQGYLFLTVMVVQRWKEIGELATSSLVLEFSDWLDIIVRILVQD